jgi:small-conductance mechanosensitive channel
MKRHHGMKTTTAFCLMLIWLSLLVAYPTSADAEEDLAVKSSAGTLHPNPEQPIEKTLSAEEDNLTQLKEQLQQARALKETVDMEIDAYKLQMSVHGNLLMFPTSDVADLEKAQGEHRLVTEKISGRLANLTEKRDSIEQVGQQAEQKAELNEKQLKEKEATGFRDAAAKTRGKQLKNLRKFISDEIRIIHDIRDVYTNRINQLDQTQKALSGLTERFELQIKNRKKQDLFRKGYSLLTAPGWHAIREELQGDARQLRQARKKSFWMEQTQDIWTKGHGSPQTFFMLLGIVLFLSLRLRKYCVLLEKRPSMAYRPWGSITIRLIKRSLPLLGAVLFLYAYAQARLIYSSVPFVPVILYVLIVFLFCQWEFGMLKAWQGYDASHTFASMRFRLQGLVLTAGLFAMTHVIVSWLLGKESAMLSLLRIAFEVAILVWAILFLKMFRRDFADFGFAKSKFLSFLTPLVIGLCYCIVVGGVLLELAGFGRLAVHWYASWGRSLVVVSWASVLFFCLREWNAGLVGVADAHEGEEERPQAVKWLFLRLAWLAWVGALLVSLILAWGGTQTVLVGLAGSLTHPIQVGNMSVRLIGFVYAFLVLLFTHALTRLWRHFLTKRVLSDSGLELGVQESIASITVYVLWGLGILVSLNAMGLSATSIVVAFGALSIGLGFGLQNIFNNFVSGLILLFERPIQVGDLVQVNDIWGSVAKINVRSTVVQTFDNASLIIPNSDMISNQVTNWSFKDQRLRRIITVGVAYGSPTELVRETLLQVAREHQRILKRPAPDVLFYDFGDSALIFKLRMWTTIEHFVAAETDVRFEIDRLFRERKIEIAFPQRDIHVRSVAENAKLEMGTKE